MKTIDHLESTLSRILGWIASADAKTAPILAISTSMLGAVAALAPKAESVTGVILIYGIITVTPLLVALIALVFVTFPRTEGPAGSMVYFKTIAAKPKHEFIEAVMHREEVGYATDLAEQCHRNAEIATKKFKALRISMVCLFVSIVPWLLLVWQLYQGRK